MTSDSSANWDDCQPGDVSRVVRTVRERRQKQVYARAAGLSVLLLAVIGGGMYAAGLSPFRFNDVDQLACRRVREMAPELLAGTLKAGDVQKVNSHLQTCEHCRTYFGREYPAYPLPRQTASESCPSGGTVADFVKNRALLASMGR